jgi:DNA-binding NarL/FixJ family response regulator/tetratricopeptide (TPR) repeat protein
VTIPLTDAPRVDAGRGPDGGGWPGEQATLPDRTAAWPDRSALWADDLAPWLPAFVGRARELERLELLLADAATGQPRIAVVEGEAGLGKSSLITEFLSRHREVPVLAASGEMSEQALPWGLVRQLAHRGVHKTWGDDPRCRFPLLAGGPPANGDPLSVGEELVALFAARSDPGGLAVVVEDLQWADQPSARALLFACRRLACDKVLVVLSARPERLSRLGDGWTRFLAGDRRCGRLALTRLSAAELGELAAACGRAGLSGRALRRVADHSRGHPLFARAMLTELPDHVLEGPEDCLYLPRSLSAVILPQLETLPAPARNLVIAASVLGETCAVSDAAVLAGVPQSDNALDQAVAAGFLVVLREQRGLRFAHELIRRAVYGDIGTARRRSLHRWAAAMADGAESLRHRVAAAAGTDQALALELDAAAALTAGRGEPADAAALHLQAARLGARGPERDGRLLSALELLVGAADAIAADVLRPLAEQLPATARRDAALGQLATLTARPAAAERLFLAAWDAHDREEPADAAAGAEAAAGLALVYGNGGSPDECRSWARRSIQASRGGGSLPTASLPAQVMARAIAGDAALALRMLSFLPDAPALVADAHADALTVRGMLRLRVGDEPGADDDLTAVVARIRGGLRPRYPGEALGYLAETAFRLGRWDEAQAHAELAVSLALEAGRSCDLPFAHNIACVVAAFRGEWEQACAHAGSAARAARAAGTRSAMLFAVAARGAVGFARNDAAEVLHGVPGGLTSCIGCATQDPTISLWRPVRIWALIRTGRLDEADAALDALESRDDDQMAVHAARLRASAALARGEPEQAEGILEACAAVADGLHNPFARALFDVEYGRCLARAHRRPAALARLRSAHEVLARLGARPFADAVAAELAALGLRGGPDADSALAGLTAQELQVARLVADGLSNREAAARLYLSPKTIEYHLAHIFAKLGVRTRYQLAARLRPGRADGPSGHPAS